MSSHDHYNETVALRDRAVKGFYIGLPVQAWAAVVRACVKASDKYRAELGNRVHGRAQNAFFENVDRIEWFARAQVECYARAAS